MDVCMWWCVWEAIALILKQRGDVPYLDEFVVPDGDELLARLVQCHCRYAVFSIVEGRHWWSIVIFERVVTWLTTTHSKLKAHHRDGQTRRGAFITYGFTAMAAMVLSNAQLSLVEHDAQIPEERTSAHLARVGFDPFGCFTAVFAHIPEYQHAVFTSAD